MLCAMKSRAMSQIPNKIMKTPNVMPMTCIDIFGTTAMMRPMINAITDDIMIDIVVF